MTLFDFDELDDIHARFSIEVKDRDFFLVDTGHKGHRSVTNDAAYVVKELIEEYGSLDPRRIFYLDSMSLWAELLVKNGIFAGFAPVQWKSPEEYISKISE